MKHYFRKALFIVGGTCIAFLILIVILFFIVSAPPEATNASGTTVNDVTQLNPIAVKNVRTPRSREELTAILKEGDGPVSIGGARHSMGGQIAAEGSVHIDMRGFDQILSFSDSTREITVQAGITWRKIQEFIDPYDLSVSIMQTYANFTVGGSLSVNAHGRYIGQGPIIHSVKSLKVILANGEWVDCSPDQKAELFYGAIGGYGGVGVIAEVTLRLTQNSKVDRQDTVLSVHDYRQYFFDRIRNDSTVIFHNADLYPNAYNTVRAVSYVTTTAEPTDAHRLMPATGNYRFERFAMWMVSEAPGGKWLREHCFDPLYYQDSKVVWRNYEASYDAMELEPHSRKTSTYVLQEYFIPVDRFDAFVPAMARILQDHDVNMINISIRHARPDSSSLLAWARTEVFCFVLYYKQGTSDADRNAVGPWTTALIDAALANNGSYYIPYQLHASKEQFLAAYPRAAEFFNLKRELDPHNRFRNKLWDKYYEP